MKLTELTEMMIQDEKVDKLKIIKALSKGIDNNKCECEIFEMIYRDIYGNKLVPKLCDKLIDCLENSEHSGSIWSLEETNSVAKKLDIDFNSFSPEEFRAMMTIEYYEHNIPLKKSNVELEATAWGRMADYKLKIRPDYLIVSFFEKLGC